MSNRNEIVLQQYYMVTLVPIGKLAVDCIIDMSSLITQFLVCFHHIYTPTSHKHTGKVSSFKVLYWVNSVVYSAFSTENGRQNSNSLQAGNLRHLSIVLVNCDYPQKVVIPSKFFFFFKYTALIWIHSVFYTYHCVLYCLSRLGQSHKGDVGPQWVLSRLRNITAFTLMPQSGELWLYQQ